MAVVLILGAHVLTVCGWLCRLNYVFVIGKGTKPYVSLPPGKGVKLSIAEERDRRLANKSS